MEKGQRKTTETVIAESKQSAGRRSTSSLVTISQLTTSLSEQILSSKSNIKVEKLSEIPNRTSCPESKENIDRESVEKSLKNLEKSLAKEKQEKRESVKKQSIQKTKEITPDQSEDDGKLEQHSCIDFCDSSSENSESNEEEEKVKRKRVIDDLKLFAAKKL